MPDENKADKNSWDSIDWSKPILSHDDVVVITGWASVTLSKKAETLPDLIACSQPVNNRRFIFNRDKFVEWVGNRRFTESPTDE